MVALDETLKAKHRVFFIVLACGGLRVSEGLSLKKEDFFWHESNGQRYLMFKSGVLKKRRKTEYRYCRIHPVIQDFVWGVISNLVGRKLFDFTSRWALELAQRHFAVEGMCTHTFRHFAYAHLDEKRVLVDLFGDGE